MQYLWAVAAAGIVGFAGNELVARWRITVGRRIGSAALVTDGLHARTDGLTSLAVVVGAAGVALGIPLADPIVALLITGMILLVLRTAARKVLDRLMDAVDPQAVDRVQFAAAEVEGVTGTVGGPRLFQAPTAMAAVRLALAGHTAAECRRLGEHALAAPDAR